MSKVSKDRMLLLGAALLVCLLGVGSFFMGEVYRINPAYFIFAFNTILLPTVIGGHFRQHFKKPLFVLFFAGWMCAHGLITVALWHYVWLWYWLPVLALELFIGFGAAYVLFGPPAEKKTQVN